MCCSVSVLQYLVNKLKTETFQPVTEANRSFFRALLAGLAAPERQAGPLAA
jgi:hypothetical protein